MGTADGWSERRKIILERSGVHTNLRNIINGAHANELSLAVFKPQKILGVKVEACDREWDEGKIDELKKMRDQGLLFEEQDWGKTFKTVPKVPYNFSYTFEDDSGKESTLQILDWEIGQLFWNCMKDHGQNEEKAVSKVKEKLLVELPAKDLHFFLGTTEKFHNMRAPNPWLIVGLFYPPIPPPVMQMALFNE